MASKLKAKRRDALLLAVFYAVVGVLQLTTLTLDIRMFWIGALAVLSLVAAYGLFTVQKWSVWLVIGLFFPQVVFGASTLYYLIIDYSFSMEATLLLLDVALAVFIFLSFVSFIYVAAKRKTFQPT